MLSDPVVVLLAAMTRHFPVVFLTAALTLSLLIAPPTAGAVQLNVAGSSSAAASATYQHWADNSYAPTYPGQVRLGLSRAQLTCGGVSGAVGCTQWSDWPLPKVDIDTAYGPSLTHGYLMHELGHVFDRTEMHDEARARFMTIWGLAGGADAWWTPFPGARGNAGEWFAESYKLCALYGPRMPYRAWTTDYPSYGFRGDREFVRQDASCRLILSVGREDGLSAPRSPAAYTPRVRVRTSHKVVECHRRDLLVLGKRVLCEQTGASSAAGPWSVVFESGRMGKVELHRAHLAAVNGRPEFA
jgi:hypothetical protein